MLPAHCALDADHSPCEWMLHTLVCMSFRDLSANSQDYLKVIWDLQEWSHEPVQPTALARRTGVKPSTVSGAVNRMAAAGLVSHTPYGAITLTARGERYALTMVRRHRLLETFLVRTLGYRWDEVHPDADALEHAVSDTMVERIDRVLGHPRHDPHGDPIPDSDGALPPDDSMPLPNVPPDSDAVITRVSDEDAELLRYLNGQGLVPGARISIGRREPYADAATVTLLPADGEREQPVQLSLGAGAAGSIRVHVQSGGQHGC